MTGRTISHYRILEKLGEGGMGVVYKAEDLKLRRMVALKFLPPHAAENRERFFREAQAAASLNHPNICTIHEIDEEHGFIAMELIEGRSVREKIESRPLPLNEAIDIVIQACAGLQAAHDKGVVHRDIKPANLMMTPQGQVKIMDFGLAQMSDQTRITKDGVTVGTPAYMSPEQVRGDATDRRTDLWSIGVLLHEMLTGRTPFQGASSDAVGYNILHAEPEPLTALRSGLPKEIDRIVGKALRKDAGGRYQNAGDLIVDLRYLGLASRAAVRPGRRRWVLVAGLAALVAAGYFAWRGWPVPESAEPLRAVPLTTLPGVQRYPSFSPDGNHVAFTWSGQKQDNPDIYVQMIGSGSPLRITQDPGNDYNPAWSPDGRHIAFLSSQAETGKSELRLVPPLGGAGRKLGEIHIRGGVWVSPSYLAWCPDSTCLVVTDSQGEGKPDALFAVSVETGEKRRLTEPRPPASGDTNPAISPDGNWLVFNRMITLFTGELHSLSLGKGITAAGEPRRLTVSAQGARDPAWLSDSREIVFSVMFGGGLWRLAVPGENKPRRLPFVGEDGLMPAISRPQSGHGSRLVYVRSFTDDNIWRVETSAPGAPASSPPVIAISSTRMEGMPHLSPDDRRVAFWSNRSGSNEIWVADRDGSNAVQLTSTAAMATGYPRWSPDGQSIVFHSNSEGQGEVFAIPAAGGKPRNLTVHPANDAFPSFSGDGRWVYFSSNRTVENRIWKMPSSGGEAVPVTSVLGYAPAESPDGAHVYYVDAMDKPATLWRVAVSGGAPVKVLDGVVLANYVVRDRGIYYIDRPAGQGGIYYLDKPSSVARLQYFDFATRRSVTVSPNLGVIDMPLTVSKDGRVILYGRLDASVDDLMLVDNFR